MATFKNLEKLVSSKILSGPNRLLLKRTRTKHLFSGSGPCIEHIYSLPRLQDHIRIYNEYLSSSKDTQLASEVAKAASQLSSILNQNLQLSLSFINGGGHLTPQAIADLYVMKTNEQFIDEWFSKSIEPRIKNNLKLFSVNNLYQILKSLKNSDSATVSLLANELKSRDISQFQTVDYDANTTTSYVYLESGEHAHVSQNPLVNAVLNNHGYLTYLVNHAKVLLFDFEKFLTGSYKMYRLDPPPQITEKQIKQLLSEVGGKEQNTQKSSS